jgi:hypothetical protein
MHMTMKIIMGLQDYKKIIINIRYMIYKYNI